MTEDTWRADRKVNSNENKGGMGEAWEESDSIPLEEKFPYQFKDGDHSVDEKGVWDRYNSQPFSPYAGEGKTLSVITVKGGLFCRREETKQDRIYIPAFVQAARGSNREFDMVGENGRVILSKHDLEDWNYASGDAVLIVGNHNRGDMFKLGTVDKSTVTTILRNEDSKYSCPRQSALDYLNERGYDVGSLSEEALQYHEQQRRSEEIEAQLSDPRTPSSFPLTKSLQKEIEEGNIGYYGERERKQVACRLLFQKGWQMAQDWFTNQFEEAKGESNSKASAKASKYYLRSASNKYESLPGMPAEDNKSTKSPW